VKYYIIPFVEKVGHLCGVDLLGQKMEFDVSFKDNGGQIGICAVYTNKKKAQKHLNTMKRTLKIKHSNTLIEAETISQ